MRLLFLLVLSGCASVAKPICEYDLFLDGYDVVKIESMESVIYKKRPIYSCMPLEERYIELPEQET